VPRGLQATFVVLTMAAVALAVVAGVRGVWFLTVICGLFAALNRGVLWIAHRRAEHPVQAPAEDAAEDPAEDPAGDPADEPSGSTAD
jgi:hypothetical protein